jgi:hypothetical protein
VSHTEEGTQAEGAGEYGAEENIWAYEDVTGEWRRTYN